MTDAHHGDHHHGHEHDRGVRAMLRYLRWAPEMWESEVNDAVVDLVGPTPGEVVVDIGAGMGPATVQAARRGADVVALEPTRFLRSILAARRGLLRGGARGRVSVVNGTAEQIPLDDGSTDAAWAVNSMHHWVDPAVAVTEIARILEPGGRIVLVDEDFTDPSHPDYERFGSDLDHDGEHHGFSLIDATEMGSLLEAAGLTDIEAGPRRIADHPALVITGVRRAAD